MDAQVIAMRAVMEDGVVTETEQALLDALKAAQERITDVDAEVTAAVRETKAMAEQTKAIAERMASVGTMIRTGKRPHRMRAIEPTLPDAA